MNKKLEVNWPNHTLYDDESVRKKLTVMGKWDAMMDDSRNPDIDIYAMVDEFVELGGTYKITLIIEEVENEQNP
jgi:hypothetical protein